MFGYVRAQKGSLSKEHAELYEAAYCGLCHAMGARYGFLSRFTLNYDFVFLAMLLAPTEHTKPCKMRCPAHPFKKKKDCLCFGGLETAADESMILTWHKLQDDLLDGAGWKTVPVRIAAWFMRRPYRKAAGLHPEFDRNVKDCLAALHRLESENSDSIDRTADSFARILSAAAPRSEDDAKNRILSQLLYHIGRWIYLTDAWDDLEKDRIQGNYNPLAVRFSGGTEECPEELRTTMTHSLRLAIAAFQLTDFGLFHAVIENILYSGLPTVQEAVLNGTWHEMKKTGRKKHE